MNLELGSGRRPHKGYTTIDIEEYANADITGDFRTMSFSDVGDIQAHHLLEHFGREESWKILKMWHGWLMQGGTITIETPDVEGICENFHKDPYWMTRHLYGSQEADWAYHKDGWYEGKFKEILPKVGFEIIGIKKSVSRKILPNITVVARKI